jgi:L-glyceraldehyde 3-phosphate reductase
VAEDNLGRALQTLGARPVVNTKVEIRAEDLGHIADHVVRSVEGSLKRLRLDAVQIVQIHNGPAAAQPRLQGRDYKTLWIEDFLRPGGALDGVRRLLDSGNARYAGLVARGGDVAELGKLLDTGLFHLVNVPFTLLNPTAAHPAPHGLAVDKDYGTVIGIARAAGAGTAVFSPLAGGVLTDAVIGGRPTHALARPKDATALEARGTLACARRFHALAAANGMSLVQLAYGFILSHPDVSTVLGGFSGAEQVDEIAAAAGDADALPADVLDGIRQIWAAG